MRSSQLPPQPRLIWHLATPAWLLPVLVTSSFRLTLSSPSRQATTQIEFASLALPVASTGSKSSIAINIQTRGTMNQQIQLPAFTLYGLIGCPHCESAEKYLRVRNLPVNLVVANEDPI